MRVTSKLVKQTVLPYELMCELLKTCIKNRPSFEKDEELFQDSLHFLVKDKITYKEAMYQLGRVIYASHTLLGWNNKWNDLYYRFVEFLSDGRRSCSFKKNSEEDSFGFHAMKYYFENYYKKDEFAEYKEYRDGGELFKGFISMARDFGNEQTFDEIIQFYLLMLKHNYDIESIEKDFNNALFTGELTEEDYEKWLNS